MFITNNNDHVVWIVFSVGLHEVYLDLRDFLKFFKVTLISNIVLIFAGQLEQSDRVGHVITIFNMTV